MNMFDDMIDGDGIEGFFSDPLLDAVSNIEAVVKRELTGDGVWLDPTTDSLWRAHLAQEMAASTSDIEKTLNRMTWTGEKSTFEID